MKRFHAICDLPEESQRLAIEAGLLYGSRSEIDELFELVERTGALWPEIERAIVSRWGEFLPEYKSRAMGLVRDLPATVAEVAMTDRAWGACEAARFVVEDERYSEDVVADMVAACAAHLAHPDSMTAGAAERAILAGARRTAGMGANQARGRVEATVARAAREYALHERAGVMHAALLLLERSSPGGPLPRWLESGGPERSAFVSALRFGRGGPRTRLRAWEFLSRPWAAPACEDRLLRRATEEESAEIADAWWLALHPARAARLRSPKLAGAVWPDVHHDSPRARHAALAMARTRMASLACLSAACEASLVDSDVGVRLAAAAVAPSSLLRDFAFDEDEAVARTASLRLSSVGEPGREVDRAWGERLGRSPHESVRVIAAGEMSLGRATTRAVAHALAAGDRAGAERVLLEQWDVGEPGQRARLVVDARAAGLEAVLGERLIDAVRHGEQGDPSVSAAASALAGVPGRGASDALAEAVHHPDPRVRSNAIEAIVRRERASGDSPAWLPASLLELKNDGHHRVRATSLRALFVRAQAGGAGDAARGMAADGAMGLIKGRGIEPVAGLWLADRLLGLSTPEAAWRPGFIDAAKRASGESGRVGARARGLVERYGEAPDRHEPDEGRDPGAALALAA